VQAYRHGRRKMVTFRDVDIVVSVERTVNGKSINFPVIVRQADKKSMSQITSEIEAVKTEKIGETSVVLGEKRPLLEWLAKWSPTFVRRLYWRKLKSDAFMIKKTMGTISVTALGMFGKSSGYIIPSAIHNLGFGLGSITRQPGLDGGLISVRQILKVTIIANHETVDGAPLARFIARLTELVEGAWGLR
jgi:pyruvate/2-oxoglutarate dehydrogenase complex dihydrolipoamide acyltransferase (E2) component